MCRSLLLTRARQCLGCVYAFTVGIQASDYRSKLARAKEARGPCSPLRKRLLGRVAQHTLPRVSKPPWTHRPSLPCSRLESHPSFSYRIGGDAILSWIEPDEGHLDGMREALMHVCRMLGHMCGANDMERIKLYLCT